MQKISACIVAKNEAHCIAECLESVKWADEIVLVDQQSSDATTAISKRFGAKIFRCRKTGFVEPAREFAVGKASNQWVLVLDADESLSKELQNEIKEMLERESSFDGFLLPFQTIFLGKTLNHSGETFFQARLFKSSKAVFPTELHQPIQVNGKLSQLNGKVFHEPYRDLEELREKTVLYSSIEARQDFSKGKSFSLLKLLFSPFASFAHKFFFRMGFLDGRRGLTLAFFAAKYKFLKQKKLKALASGHSAHLKNPAKLSSNEKR